MRSTVVPSTKRYEIETVTRMSLADILQPECVKVPLVATGKQAVIHELAELLCDGVGMNAHEELKTAIWNREQTRTTGIGHGIAIPHGKIKNCSKLTMAVGIAREPIEFNAIDGKPVSLIFLLASPEDQTGPHIQALSRISRMLIDDDFRGRIKQAKDAGEAYALIRQRDLQGEAV